MKKAITKTLLVLFSVFILAGVIPLSANAASTSNNNKTKIFSYLTNELDFNSAAACGIMANIEKESNFRSNVIIRDSNGLLSGGLCMWNGGRLNNLKSYCSKNGLNYLSIEGQLSYLKAELQKKQYSHIYKYLMNVKDNSSGAYDAAYYWCYYFEVPVSRGSKSVQRGNTAVKSYWPVYGNKDLKSPKLQFTDKKDTYEAGSSVKLKWTKGGDDADGYKVYLVKKNPKTGKYDYENSKIFFMDKGDRALTIKKKYLDEGTYKLYAYAYNKLTDTEVRSNVLVLKIQCTEHNYKSEITKVPTDEKAGKITHTCKKCGAKDVKKLTMTQYIELSKVPGVKITGIAENAIKIRWDEFKEADGYRIYANDGEKWISLGYMDSKQERVLTIKGLETGKQYKFRVYAYKLIDGKKVFTEGSKVVSATTKKQSK